MPRAAVASFLLLVPLLAFCSAFEARDWKGRPVVVVGVDGATWDVIDPMLERGELPHFRQLLERGARSDLIILPPLLSPVVWTTFATGTFGRTHGIIDFAFPYVAGVPKQPVQSTQRRVPAIWNLATDAGRSVGIVGYYATHPAEVVNGFMISDIRLQGKGGSVYPAGVLAGLDLVDTIEELQAGVRKIVGWDYDPTDTGDDGSPQHYASRVIRGRIDNGIVKDENVRRAALKLQPMGVDLFVTYFRIVDHTSHAAWIYYDDFDFTDKPDPAVRKLLATAIPNAYRWVDAFLGELMERYGEDANIVVVSDHGFGSATGHYALPAGAFDGLVSGNHRTDGVLLAAGPDLRHGTFEGVSLLDVAPLLLTLLGLPVSEELPGRVPSEMLQAQFLEANPPRSTERYAVEWSHVEAAPLGSKGVKESMRELEALGYIEKSTKAQPGRAVHDFDFWSSDRSLLIPAIQGEILFHVMRGHAAEVGRLIALSKEHDLGAVMPDYVHEGAQQLQSRFSFDLFPDHSVSGIRKDAQRRGVGIVSLAVLLLVTLLGFAAWRRFRRRSAVSSGA